MRANLCIFLMFTLLSPPSGHSTNNFDINTLNEDECHTKL